MSVKIRCVAVDDEPMALEKLNNYITNIPYLELVALCESTYEALNVLASQKVDAIFVDVNMPDVNGLDFVKSLVDPPLIIFTTAYAEYALDSYKVNAVDYLLKPFGFSDFQHASSKLYKQYILIHPELQEESSCVSNSDASDDFIYFKVDSRYVRVEFKDIMYIEGMNEYLKIYLTAGTPFLTHITLKQVKENLPENFIQVHRSYLINLCHVKEVERSVVQMTDGCRISVSESFKDSFMQYLQKHSLKK